MRITTERWRLFLSSGACAIGLIVQHSLNAQEQPVAPQVGQQSAMTNSESGEDLSILESGPVHEAFAEAITLDAQPDVIVPEQPPEPIPELPPETRPEGENVIWIPGYWAWIEEDEDFIWVSGVWRAVPPDQQWIPGYWSEESGGYRWTHGFWESSDAEELMYLPAPPESLEAGPTSPSPGDDYFYIPGCWRWNDGNYAWRPGFWHQGYNDWVWVPSHYQYTPRGYVYLNGYWDYPLQRRGSLFAPVRFRRPIYRQPGYRYTPSAAINLGQLALGLFVSPRRGHYFYGNYYGQQYASAGYYPWFDYGNRRFGYDPLFNYASRQNRGLLNELRQDYDRFADTGGRNRRGPIDRDNPLIDDQPNRNQGERNRPNFGDGDRNQGRQGDDDQRPRLVQNLTDRADENAVRLSEDQRREAAERRSEVQREFRQRRAEAEAQNRREDIFQRPRRDRGGEAGATNRPTTQTPNNERPQVNRPDPDRASRDRPRPDQSPNPLGNVDQPRADQPRGQRPQIGNQPQQREAGPANGRFQFPQRANGIPQQNRNPASGASQRIGNRPPQIPQQPNRSGGPPNVGRRGGNPAASGQPGGGNRGGSNRGGGGNRGGGNRGNN